MKTIFRYTGLAAMLALLLAVTGAVIAQTPTPVANPACADTAGLNDLDAKVRAAFADKTITGKKSFVDLGKQFLEKFGGCPGQTEFVDWLKVQVPKQEGVAKDMEIAAAKLALLKRFDTAMDAKNWDETYAAGKEVLAKYPDEFRAVELVLASIGYDEMFNKNTKFVDDTLRYAKLSLADLEANKEFKPSYGLKSYSYKTKDEAIAWMNLTIGSLLQVGKKDKAAALPYLYKATLATGTPKVSNNPNPYDFIGSYYTDELDKIIEQIQTKAKDQKDTDTPEVAKAKVDELKALVAMSNGYSERAMDAYGRAYTYATDKDYKTKTQAKVAAIYKVRFGKDAGAEAWVASAIAKPFMNPQTPVAPITDPEATPATTGATTTPTAPPANTKPPVTTPVNNVKPPTKPAVTTPAKPAGGAPAKPPTKRQAAVKKPVTKKKA